VIKLKVKISEIKKKREVFLRDRLNQDAIERYMELYKQGKTKAIVVQKGTKVLIDGYHRLEALKRLGEEYVEVEERVIPDSKLVIEAYRLNEANGVSISRKERNNLIIKLKFDLEMKHVEIAKIVNVSIGTITRICDNFIIFNSKKTKVDLRKKTDSKEIIKAYQEGIKQREIAGKFHISEGRVSQIVAKHGKWKEKGKVNIFSSPKDFMLVFKVALGNGLFETSVLELKKEGIFIRENKSDKNMVLLAFFSKHFFGSYEVKEEINVLCDETLSNYFDSRKTDQWLTWGDDVTASFDEEHAYIGAMEKTDSMVTLRFEPIDDKKFRPNIPIDENGFVKIVHVKFCVHPWDFLGMGIEEQITISLVENNKLKVDCVMPHHWKASKVITPLKIEGERFPLVLDVPSDKLSRVLKLADNMESALKNRGRGTQTWICFFKDKPYVVLTILESPETPHGISRPWFVNFLIGSDA